MNAMLDFICMGQVELQGTRRTPKLLKLKKLKFCPKWDSNQQPLDYEAHTLSVRPDMPC